MCQYLVVSQRTGRSSIVRSLRQLKRTTTNVKSLLIHPRNVSAVVEQLRFRYGRPEQLIRSRIVLGYVLREYFLNKTALERQSA